MTVMNHFGLDLAWRSLTSWPHAVFCEELSLSLENGSLNSISHGEQIHVKRFCRCPFEMCDSYSINDGSFRCPTGIKKIELMFCRQLHWFLIDELFYFFSLLRFVMLGAFVWTCDSASTSSWQTRAQFHWRKPDRHRWLSNTACTDASCLSFKYTVKLVKPYTLSCLKDTHTHKQRWRSTEPPSQNCGVFSWSLSN